MRKPCCKRFGVMVLFTMLFAGFAEAQFQQSQPEPKELSPVSRTYAITNATIFQAPGRKIDRGTIVLKDGLITSVGKNVSIPPDAIVIKGDSLHIYAGFIDGLSHAGVTKPKDESNRERPKDPGNPSPEIAGITPYQDVRTSLNPTDKSVEDLRAAGFTVTQVIPYGGMLPGTGAIISLTGKTADEMILAGKSVFYSELAPAQRVYPSTVIGVMAKWREMYRQATLAKNYETLYASNKAGLNRPASDRSLEAFYPVIDKKLPVLFEADKYLDIQRVLALQADFGFSVIVGDVKEGWDAIDKLKAAGAKVFLSLELPEEKKDKKDDKNPPKKEEPKKDDSAKADPEKEALEKRKAESIKQYIGQAATFKKAGIPFGFSTLTVKTSDIQSNLRKMIASGLTEDDALAALTTSPAQLLGLSDRLGSVDQGKIANLVISDKPYFNEKAKVRYVFVDGLMYKYDPKEQPKTDVPAGINITGTWTVTTQTAAQKQEEKVTFTKEGNTYSGSITGAGMSQAVALEGIELTGNKLKYSYTTQAEGQSLKVNVEATIAGNTFKGTSSAGSSTSFSIEGKKDPKR
ncbi:amidohydrolase family protein [Chryseosolibacter indicus]|uniref:Amidohydrolase family protein n=1 Tax=Chryseosolibacter indicus TaxID=2782351 RepID=A0ABS5VUU1_9BACT|nr:amidohydrolase family protein [Chryseosolibacter indicus]MBT1704966.1 amidohydrolase family protein [Chryseosolibacter indicus]